MPWEPSIIFRTPLARGRHLKPDCGEKVEGMITLKDQLLEIARKRAALKKESDAQSPVVFKSERTGEVESVEKEPDVVKVELTDPSQSSNALETALERGPNPDVAKGECDGEGVLRPSLDQQAVKIVRKRGEVKREEKPDVANVELGEDLLLPQSFSRAAKAEAVQYTLRKRRKLQHDQSRDDQSSFFSRLLNRSRNTRRVFLNNVPVAVQRETLARVVATAFQMHSHLHLVRRVVLPSVDHSVLKRQDEVYASIRARKYTCSHCGKQGHPARNCPKLVENLPSQPSNPSGWCYANAILELQHESQADVLVCPRGTSGHLDIPSQTLGLNPGHTLRCSRPGNFRPYSDSEGQPREGHSAAAVRISGIGAVELSGAQLARALLTIEGAMKVERESKEAVKVFFDSREAAVAAVQDLDGNEFTAPVFPVRDEEGRFLSTVRPDQSGCVSAVLLETSPEEDDSCAAIPPRKE